MIFMVLRVYTCAPNGQNKGLRGAEIMISPIVSGIKPHLNYV